MDGHGAVASLPPGIPAVDPEVELYWPPTGFGSLRPASNARGRFGPEISLGRDLAAALPNQRIMLVKFAIGGTNLFQQWHPGDELDDPTVGPLYPQWTDAVAEAVAQLEAEGASPRIAGLFWMQGESDGGSAGTALAYEANLGRLVRRARDDMDGVSAPFVIGRIFAPTVTFRDIIRTAEQQVVADIHHTVWVDTDDLPLGDPIHYDAHGQLVLGRRFAAAALQMPDEPPPEWPAEIDLGAAAPESAEYEIVRSVALPTSATWHASEDVPYDLDRSEELAGTSFDRMAFFVELAARDRGRAWVWVSIDAPAEDLAAAGVPTALSFQGPIAGLSVRSSDETVAALDGTAAGNIEFWDNCYATGDDGLPRLLRVDADPRRWCDGVRGQPLGRRRRRHRRRHRIVTPPAPRLDVQPVCLGLGGATHLLLRAPDSTLIEARLVRGYRGCAAESRPRHGRRDAPPRSRCSRYRARSRDPRNRTPTR